MSNNDSKMTKDNSAPRTIEILLTRGYVAIVDEQDADLAKYAWHAHIGRTGRVYARRGIKVGHTNRRIWVWLHKVIFCRSEGILFAPPIVDHIDNDSLNDTRRNLREATQSENCRNSGKRKKSVLKGAHYHKRDKKWTSSINNGRKTIHLGTFDTPEEAHEAYAEASKKYHGKFSRTE